MDGRIIHNTFYPGSLLMRARGVKVMVVHVGLLFTGLIIRTILAVVVLAVFVWLALKLGRLADAYTERISGKKG